MTDAVSDMLRTDDNRPEKQETTMLLPEVTAIVKYDTYPHYNVLKGYLQMDGSVVAPGIGRFIGENLFRILPVICYEEQASLRDKIRATYREKERQLRIDILSEMGVDFVAIK